jgi:hypothetical protein
VRTRGPGTVALAALIAFAVIVAVIARLAPEPKGPDSSAYATSARGLAAYAELLRDFGHAVKRQRTDVRHSPPDPKGTLVVLDAAAVAPDEARAIGAFVRAGGQLVAGGSFSSPWLGEALGEAPLRTGGPAGDRRPLAPAPETAGVGTVRSLDGGAWRNVGAALPVLGASDAPLAVVVRRGRGRALLLADASPLQNRALDLADNAAFGLAAAGPDGRRVTFLETVHGYGSRTGLAALPPAARWALLGLVLAGLAFAWSHWRRIGPPEEAETPLPPPRRDYVEALAAILVRTKQPDEVARPLREAARARLAGRAGLARDAREDQLRAAGRRFGLTDEEIDAVVGGEDGLAAGRALARLEGGG